MPIHLSHPSDQTLTFQYQTADGNAIAGQDYTALTGTVTFLPGQTSVAAIIPIIGDAIDEPSEIFSLTVTPTPEIANGSAGSTGIVTILDGDVLPPPVGITVSAGNNENINEGSLFTRTVTFIDDLDTNADGWIFSVDWGDGSAVENGAIVAGANSFNISRLLADGDASHTVSVTVTDVAGDSDTQQFQLNVNNVAPTIALLGADSVPTGVSYTLNLGAIADPGQDTVTSYIVNWGDGSSETFNSAGDVTHVYATAGNTTITVDLIDEDGTHINAGSLAIAVNTPPAGVSLDAGENAALNEGSLFSRTMLFTDGEDTDADGWTYSVDWGDGSAVENGAIAAGANSFNISRLLADGDASHTVSVTVTDVAGDSDTQQFQLNVNNVAPTIALLGADSVPTGVSYTLNLGAIADPGQDTVTSYIVNWGDGSSETFNSAGDVTHVYATAGNTTITVDLIDEDGTHINAGSLAVAVSTPPAGVSLDVGENAALNEGSLFTRTITFSDGEDAGGDGWTYSVDWGDGSATENGVIETGANSFNISRFFADGDASHTISVTVTDTASDTDMQQFVLDVSNVAPAIALNGATTANTGDNYTLNLGAVVDPGDDTVTSYIVNWGDGTSDIFNTVGNVNHAYAAEGDYTISVDLTDEDGTHISVATQLVAVTTPASNTPPVAVDDNYAVHANETLVVNAAGGLLANDTDADGDPLQVLSFTAPGNGTLNAATDGSFTYKPDTGFVGSETLNYTITDGVTTAVGTFVIDVENGAPVANNDAYSVKANEILVVNAAGGLLANDTDIDGDALSVVSFVAPSNGTLNVATDGSFTYNPNAGFVGSETLNYTITDGVTVDTGTFVIDVTNIAPVANNDAYSVKANETLVVNAAGGLLANDTDIDGDALSVVSFVAPSNGTLNVATDGSFTYNPNAGFVGSETLNYTITDGVTVDTGTFVIDVTNIAPVANNDAYSVKANETLVVNAAGGVLANDTDADGDALSVVSFTAPSNGVINMTTDGAFTYNPNAGFVGTETLNYTITDGVTTAVGTFVIDVENAVMPVIVNIGDAPLRVSRSNPDTWEQAWTNSKVDIVHKANYQDSNEPWSDAVLNGLNSGVLNGGDIFGGDLGVSGQSLASSAIRQEIDGTEALRFDLDQAATKITIDLSRLDGNSSTGHFDAGRLQLLDSSGTIVDELIFSADAAAHEKQITLDHSGGFSAVVLTAGIYNGVDFIYGGLADATGQYLSDPHNLGNGAWNASEYLVDAVEIEFGDISLVGIPS